MNEASTHSRFNAAGQQVDRAADAMKDKAHAGLEATEDAMMKAQQMAKSVSDQAMVAKDKLAAMIEERPLTAVIIAFGIGAVLARLMKR